jgi:hypothetical protein
VVVDRHPPTPLCCVWFSKLGADAVFDKSEELAFYAFYFA